MKSKIIIALGIVILLTTIGCREVSQKVIKETSSEILEKTTKKGLKNSVKQIASESDKFLSPSLKKLTSNLFENSAEALTQKNALKSIINEVEKGFAKDILKKSGLSDKLVEKSLRLNKRQQANLIFDLSNANPKSKNLFHYISADIKNFEAYTLLNSKRTSYSIRSNTKYISQIKKQLEKGVKTPRIKLNNPTSNNSTAKYIKRDVQIDGIVYSGYFPDFSDITIAKFRLPQDLYTKYRALHFKKMDEELKKDFIKNPQKYSFLSKKQIDEVLSGKTPTGYTWHHSETKGLLELVESGIHNKTKHLGGNALWAMGKLDI